MEKLKSTYILIALFCCFQVKAQSRIEKIGDYGLYSLPVVAFSTALIEKDKEGIYMFGKSFLLNTAVTFGLKELIKKERPNKENFKSFPSAHTSITFQSAAFIQKRYGWKYGIPAYTVAAYTGFSRVHAKKHFVEDVVVGAGIGILSSYLFTHKKKQTTSFAFGKYKKDFKISYTYKF